MLFVANSEKKLRVRKSDRLLGNGVVLSWAQDQTHTAALDSVLRTLAALPCSI